MHFLIQLISSSFKTLSISVSFLHIEWGGFFDINADMKLNITFREISMMNIKAGRGNYPKVSKSQKCVIFEMSFYHKFSKLDSK